MTTTFLMKYYTDAVGIAGATIGVMFLIARFWDAITDVLMGILINKAFVRRLHKFKGRKEHVNKFKPFFKWGAWFVSISAIMMFLIPHGWLMGAKIGFMYATYILWGMCYTFVNIPYGSIASVMTMNAEERASLFVARGLGSSIGQQFPKIFVPFILGIFAGNLALGYLASMIVFSIIAIICYYACYFMVEENVETPVETNKQKATMGDYFAVIFKNRPLIAVSIGSIAILAGILTNSQMMVYYFENVLGRLGAMGLITTLTLIPTFVLAPILPKLVQRFSIKMVTAFSSLAGAVVFGVLHFLPSNLITYGIFYIAGIALLNIPLTLVWEWFQIVSIIISF